MTSHFCWKKAIDVSLGCRAGYGGGGVTARAALEILRKLVMRTLHSRRNICVQCCHTGIILLRNVGELVLKAKVILVSFIAGKGLDLALIKHH